MKLQRILFLSEAISLTSLEPDIIKCVQKSVREVIDVITDKKFIPLYSEWQDAISTKRGELLADKIGSTASNLFADALKHYIMDLFASKDDMLNNIRASGRKIQVTFKAGMHVNGQAASLHITISKRILETILKKPVKEAILLAWEDQAGVGPDEMLSAITYTLRYIDVSDDGYVITARRQSDSTEGVNALTSTLIHELTHVIQHSKQMDRGEFEYRSYMQKDRTKFYAAVAQLVDNEDIRSTDVYKVYRASPQEIDAFAQEAALRVLKSIDFPTIARSLSKAELMDELKYAIASNLDTVFKDRKTPAEIKSFNRFNKRMYLEVVRRVDAAYDKQ